MFISDYGDANGYSLCDYIPDGVEAIDVSSPLWLVAGPNEWKTNVADFVTNKTTGKDRLLFGYWAAHGSKITHDGRFVWVGLTQEYFGHRYARNSNLGGRDGNDLNPVLASAFVGSTIKTYELVKPRLDHVLATPFNDDPTFTSRTIISGVTEDDIQQYIPSILFRLNVDQ